MRYGQWAPYVSVAKRRRNAAVKIQQLKKKGIDIQPVEIEGRKIAKSFWGIAWNDHLESFSDYANRIPRGRTYVRNGSVCHLDIQQGEITAIVSGSKLYNVSIAIKSLTKAKWVKVKKQCTGQIGSLLELLQGKLSESVMEVVTDREKGLFPGSREIKLGCDCPDGAYMCKHIAAALYGVGARLDHQPELLFKLRGVDHEELVSMDVGLAVTTGKGQGKSRRIADDSLADVFGIEMTTEEAPVIKKKTTRKKAKKKAAKKIAKKKSVKPAAKKASTAKKRVKKAAKKKIVKKKPQRERNAKGELIFTSQDVVALRKKFLMSPIEFALLMGVSTLTINNWEQKSGSLALRKYSRQALEEVEKFSKRKAWQQMQEL